MKKKDKQKLVSQVINTLVAVWYKESQVFRNIKISRQKKYKYKNLLLDLIINLVKKVEDGSLKNIHIRNAIKKLHKQTKIQVGLCQKVINVYLKYYCILRKKNKLLKHLDCPLDRKTHLKGIGMKDITTMDQYRKWQNKLKKKGKGIRILADIQYDKQRILKYKEDTHRK